MSKKLVKNMNPEEYRNYVESMSPKSKFARNVFRAFIVGGLICVVGQIITNFFKAKGYDNEVVGSITSIIMIFLGALLTGLNIYDEIGKFAGAGSAVPVTGFANSIVAPAMEFKSEGYIMGVGAKMFAVAGPVLVYGTSASIIAGIIYYLLRY